MPTTSKNHGEGNPEAAAAYNDAGTRHSRRADVAGAARAAVQALEAAPAAHAQAELEGASRARELDPEVARPSWWVEEHESTWERVKLAVRRDWEQTLSDLTGDRAGQELDQSASDTLRQMVGAAHPVKGEPSAVTTTPDWERDERAAAFGYFAGEHYLGPWSRHLEAQLASDWRAMDAGPWSAARPAAYVAWQARLRQRRNGTR